MQAKFSRETVGNVPCIVFHDGKGNKTVIRELTGFPKIGMTYAMGCNLEMAFNNALTEQTYKELENLDLP